MRAPIGLEGLLSQQDVLILHSGWVYHNVQAARAAARARLPYVLMPHGAYEPNVFKRRSALKRGWWRMFERDLVLGARAIHVFFDEQSDELRRLGYSGPIVVAPTGLSIPEFGPQAARSDYVLWMGRFDIKTKGLDLLLQALASLPPNVRPGMRLHGPDFNEGKQEVAQLVRKLGLEDSVAIGPPLYGAEKWEALRDCGLFVFPSRWDAQSVMLLEAAAADAPMVVTNTTPFGRFLASQQVAVLVEATPQSIATGFAGARTLSGAGEFRTRASQLVREQFSWQTVAESYTRQLRAIL